MALKLILEQKLTQSLIMTPQLRQLIKLLTLSRLELEDRIQVELDNNPLLEREITPGDLSKEEKQAQEQAEKSLHDMEEWLSYLEETPTRRSLSVPEEDFYTVEHSRQPSRREELDWQIRVSKLTDVEKEIAFEILGNLDSDGYLRLPMDELLVLTGADEDSIEKVRLAIQQLDPPGIASHDLVECLLVQAKLRYPDSYPLLEKILTRTLRELESHRYSDIARKLRVNESKVHDAVTLITSLNPQPGQEFFDPQHFYIHPDAEIVEEDGEYKIILNDALESSIKINPFYRALLRRKKDFTIEERKFLEEKYLSARQLIDGLQRRHSTLYNVLDQIIQIQRAFLDNGLSHLVPLTLKEVADKIGVHETTVSRITRKKYVQTPRGLFSLKFFFGRGLEHNDTGEVAVKSVMERISHLVDSENAAKPLSDRDITLILQKEGVQIARRTVAKYRKLLKIDSTQRRRRIKKIKR